jgi:nucleoside-diphosphate-sugar epimerase
MMGGERRILLTGAGGFIGRHVLREAASGGSADLWILTDFRQPERWWGLPGRTEFVAGDLAGSAFCAELFRRAEITHVVHLAGWLGKGDSKENRDMLIRANLLSTLHLLDAARSVPPPHFLLPSTGLIYGDQPGPFREDLPVAPQDDYAISKHLAEQALVAHARQKLSKACIVRPAVVYGSGQQGDMFVPSLVRSLAAGRRFAMTPGGQKRDMIHVQDLARAVLLLLEAGSEGVFNAGTGVGTEMKAVGEIAGRIFGRPDLIGIGDLPYRTREVWDYALDPSRLGTETGWVPRIDLEEGIRRTIEWEKQTP